MSDLQGAGRLTVDAIQGIINLVEATHQAVSSLGGLLDKPDRKHTRGISGLVYKGIRSVTGLAGSGVDTLLEPFSRLLGDKEPSPEREAVVAALNGLFGDHLVKRKNPLAIPMQLRGNGKPIALDNPAFTESINKSNGKIVLLVHGLCMNDLEWNAKSHDHGAALARDLGYCPVYLHYNTGRHISENGREFAGLLESFTAQIPGPIELVILAHSMGGLVSRSACHYGKLAHHTWLEALKKMVFLGTPHHGAPLEQGGNWIDTILEISPYSAPFSRLGKIRSSGITDLRYGNVIDEDWKGRDRFKPLGDQRIPVPLPGDVLCYAIAATMGKEPNTLGDGLVGDGLVPLNSALGRHENPALNLAFPEDNQWIGRNMGHLDLLNHPEVFSLISKWVSQG